MTQFVWEFVALADKLEDFERHFSASGSWAGLFRRSAGYQGTTLLRDAKNARRFLTIDRWESDTSFRAMRERFAREYDELDRACEAFIESERSIGVFEEE